MLKTKKGEISPSVKVGLVSDVHATPAPLKEAIEIFRAHGVETVLCPGDIAGYGDQLEETVILLQESGCQAVLGNHEVWQLEEAGLQEESAVLKYFRGLPATLDTTLAGKHIHMVHASPQSYLKGIRLLDDQGEIIAAQKAIWSHRLAGLECDVLVVGHAHQVFAEYLGGVLVVNPGSTVFNHTCAILKLPQLTVQWFPLSGKTPVKVWHWGDQVPE